MTDDVVGMTGGAARMTDGSAGMADGTARMPDRAAVLTDGAAGLTDRAATLADGAVLSPPVPRLARSVLLVEDEEAVRRLTKRALQRAGWEVYAVDSAEAALERLLHPGDAAGPPGVLLSDIMLPGMHGTELVRMARAMWPNLPAVLVSGYTDSALLGDLTAQGVLFLTKPFRLRELVACVERAAAGSQLALSREPDVGGAKWEPNVRGVRTVLD
jgi:CheY-like chemotaxis protein